jgi:putative flavoprotein involved in K+ transport
MNDIDRSALETAADTGLADIAAAWLGAFETALARRDAAALERLFVEDSHWRDTLAFTWHLTPTIGATAIARRLAERQAETKASNLKLAEGRSPPRKTRRIGVDVIEAIFDLETAVGSGNGVVRLVVDPNTQTHKAWVLLTTLEELKGFEEKIGRRRPTGAAYSRNFGGDNWDDVRRKAQSYADHDPTVLVVGGAQAGLSIAARLNQVCVDALVVERWPRIGDSWRKRYHSLALHNAINVNHLPYMPFPATWPKYIPKDMLGLWFECYAQIMEINHWTSTEFVKGAWDDTAKRWTAHLKHADGTERTLHPRHIVFANGVSSYPRTPTLPGLDLFKGDVIHSEGFDSGAPYAGKSALIIGTGSSANDIALDLHSFGCRTTLVQRGSTTVVSIEPSAALNYALYDEGLPFADCDLIASAATPPLILKAYQASAKRMVELDHGMIEGLKGIGFKFDIGDDQTGHQMKYRRRGGGYNLDAGSSELMIKREIGLLQYETIEQFCPEGARLKDGRIVPADLIVLATGYFPQAELVRRALGEDMLERIGPVWGEAADGELSNMFKRTPQENLWFIAGSLAQCRVYSKYMALQIRAAEEGMIGKLDA